jgi:hypothetical protein
MVVIIPGLTSDSDDAVNLQDTRPCPSYVLFQSQCNVNAMGEFGGNSM